MTREVTVEYEVLSNLLANIEGCTFATIDSETFPSPGLRCVTRGTRVILYTNKNGSGYAAKVRRHLVEAGKNASDFVLSDLPWGEKIPNTPFISHRGIYYLQTVILEPGQSNYFIGDRPVDASYAIRPRRTNQGLPPGSEVFVSTYRLESIIRVAAMGEVLTADRDTRSLLRIKT
jgi:hypothetical protein